ncbi:MAG: ribonuclease III family protein [Metamycoplasmataceae bacterium]
MINKYPKEAVENLKKLLKTFNLDENIDQKKTLNYLKSFTHLSYANKYNLISYESYEFLGDAILQYIVSEYILNFLGYDKKLDEIGTKIRSKIVNKESLSNLTKKFNLNKYLLVINDEEKNNEKICSDLFESFVASIYLNCGLEKVRIFLKKTLFKLYTKEYIQKLNLNDITDNKSKFQEIIQGAFSNKKIKYICKDTKEKEWECSVCLVDEQNEKEKLFYGKGIALTKKEAEQKAAGEALKKLKI